MTNKRALKIKKLEALSAELMHESISLDLALKLLKETSKIKADIKSNVFDRSGTIKIVKRLSKGKYKTDKFTEGT